MTSSVDASPPVSRHICYVLLNSQGTAYKKSKTCVLSLSPESCIGDFKRAIKADWNKPGYLNDTPHGMLEVFADHVSFEGKTPLSILSKIGDLGLFEDKPLVVVVPDPTGMIIGGFRSAEIGR